MTIYLLTWTSADPFRRAETSQASTKISLSGILDRKMKSLNVPCSSGLRFELSFSGNPIGKI